MKQIGVLLMTPEEALVEAATTGQLDWIDRLLDDLGWVVPHELATETLVAAAANNHLEVVEVLVAEKAAEAAAENRHLDVVRCLVTRVMNPKWYLSAAWIYLAIRPVLGGAAGNGHLRVVEFMVEHARQNDYARMYSRDKALEKAFSGGNQEMVEFLSHLDCFGWDVNSAFEAAIRCDDSNLAEIIYNAYPRIEKGGD
ncbi:hypothetical protein PHYPSEUDO_012012 [Phytophthora pseudosyringae]|uniref:Uncharacterized protein n=1 Tax=Phytophthora pseudosyringae TaxID=221518 RepID=A0A8T1V874_9STRA|nr:hypothetical protein PHYPSEUDO_012012 [Phytophthora pseudosyringae]